jgi:translation elongation factor EF-G
MAMPPKARSAQHLYGIHGAEVETGAEGRSGRHRRARLSYMEAGGTLCEPGLQMSMNRSRILSPCLYAIEPASQQELPRLREALQRFTLEDPLS